MYVLKFAHRVPLKRARGISHDEKNILWPTQIKAHTYSQGDKEPTTGMSLSKQTALPTHLHPCTKPAPKSYLHVFPASVSPTLF